MALFRLKRRTQAFNWEFTERRVAERLPLQLAVRLRIGTALYEGHTKDAGAMGVGVDVTEETASRYMAEPRLHSGEQGALELFSGEQRLVVRVRIARVQRRRGLAYVGLAIAAPEETDRLVQWLATSGYAYEQSLPVARECAS